VIIAVFGINFWVAMAIAFATFIGQLVEVSVHSFATSKIHIPSA